MLDRSFFAEYERMSKDILRYRENPPLELFKNHEKSLAKLREYLYQNKMYMKLPKYPYDPEDKKTHSFIINPDGPGSIPNPNYIYKDVWVRIDGVKGVK